MADLILSLSSGINLYPRVGQGGNGVIAVGPSSPAIVPSGQLVKVLTDQVRFRSGALVAVDGGVRVSPGIYSATVDFQWASTDLVSRIGVGESTPFSNTSSRELEGSYTVLFEVKATTTVFVLARQDSGSPVALAALQFSVTKLK